MTEINVFNFPQKFVEIKKNIEEAKFISIDLEFSGLYPLTKFRPSLFDDPKERYVRMRKNAENIIPLQIGLTTYKFDADGNKFTGIPYTFYVKPGVFSNVARYFIFESETIEFLTAHDFDFNQCFYSGLPFLNKIQEDDLRKKFKNSEVFETCGFLSSQMKNDFERVQKNVKDWYENAIIGDIFVVNDISELYHFNIQFRYYFHKYIERTFGGLWIYLDENHLLSLRKVGEEEMSDLKQNNDLDEAIIDSLLGFAKIYKLLVSLKKPLIAHNSLMDVVILINNFEGCLPRSYQEFKKLTLNLFPVIFDTKHIYYEMRQKIPQEKLPSNSDLETLFEYFKDGRGRHIALHSPPIEFEGDSENIGKFHNAGWDSFCAGYVFIRLAYLEIYKKHPLAKIFMPTEYLGGMFPYKNCLNIIRANVNYINLNGVDPSSQRPPLYVIETNGNEKLDFVELTSVLSGFGSIDIKPLSCRRNKAIIAVDNYPSAKLMIREFSRGGKFKVQPYSWIRHSPFAKAAILGGVTISGITLVLLIRNLQTK